MSYPVRHYTICILLLILLTTASSARAQNLGWNEEISKIPSEISVDRIESDIRTLANFGTRHTLSDTLSDTRGIGAARRWIYKTFKDISTECGDCLDVYYQKSVVSGTQRIPDSTWIVNVIAIQRGIEDPNRYVIMSGDIDSRISDGMNGVDDSPGANDNASGMAGTIEAARVLSKREFSGSIVYAGLSGEEQGLFGGKSLAKEMKENEWFVEAILNNDMIGNSKGINGVSNNTTARVFSEGTRYLETDREARMRRYMGGEVDSPSRNIGRFVDAMADLYIENLDVMMIYRLDRFGRGGHHRPFNEEGFPGVRIMETNEHYDRQHQDLRNEDGRHFGDTIEYVDFDYAAKLTGLNAVTLASLATAPEPPRSVEIKGAVQASTTLSWESANGAVAYRLYWRLTTDPVWTRSRWVGDLTSYTLQNIVIDNYFFGVASISKEGVESPVVFPGPMGSFARVTEK